MKTINEKIEEVKKGCKCSKYDGEPCGKVGVLTFSLCPVCQAKLQAYQEAREIMLSEIENLNLNANPKDNCLILNKKELKEKLKVELAE